MFLLYGAFLILVLFVVFRFALWYSSAMTYRIVERKHRDMEFVSQTGVAPPRWRPKLLLHFGMHGAAKSWALRKLAVLLRYVRHSPLVDNEEARRQLVADLESVREQWEEKGCGVIYPQE